MSLRVGRLLGVTGSAAVTAALALATVAVPAETAGTAWTSAPMATLHSDVVIARDGQVAAAVSAVRALDGKVGTPLSIINGFTAGLSSAAATELNNSGSVVSVTANSALHSASSSWDPSAAGATEAASVRATGLWEQSDTGRGVTVAVLDTGVADVPDLHGRLVRGPDFSGEGNSLEDGFGHGTVMAGLIAGDGSASDGAYPGIAPDAQIVSVKVAGRNGATDVSTVLAGLQWIGTFASQYGIKVVSLAWGTPSQQSASIDPLDFAVERLWSLGITVVVSAGNAGPGPSTITKPGDDPAVITVGAFDDQASASQSDDTPLDFSSRGPTADGVSKPDVVAPGRSLIAVASPDSEVVQNNPQAMVDDNYIRGSGTSQATAVTAGSIALLLAARPDLTPDQVKYALTSTAHPISGVDPTIQGAGELRVSRAAYANPNDAPAQALNGDGTGSLEASRGGVHIWTTCPGDSTPTEVIGEMDAQCQPFSAESWSAESWSAESWSAESWSAESWSAESWSAESWSAESWSAESWSAESWSAESWSSHSWDGPPDTGGT